MSAYAPGRGEQLRSLSSAEQISGAAYRLFLFWSRPRLMPHSSPFGGQSWTVAQLRGVMFSVTEIRTARNGFKRARLAGHSVDSGAGWVALQLPNGNQLLTLLPASKPVAVRVCIENDEFRINNDEFCIKNDAFLY